MATITSSGSGLFSAGGTWVGGVAPGNGDGFVIAPGHSVEFDLDTSVYAAGFAASTINGTLRAKRSAGSYFLKMNGILTVSTTGMLDASDGSGGAYPANCTATILLNGNFSITVSGSGAVNLICGEPTIKYVRLSAGEAIGETTLSIDTDVTAETLWVSGALVRIDDINQAAESEERTISGAPTATTITVSVGLTAAKAQGAYVILVSRNVKILGTGTASGTGISGGANGVIGAEIRSIATGISAVTGATVGGSISGVTTGMAGNCADSMVNASITGMTTGVSTGFNLTFHGLISGCSSAALLSVINPIVAPDCIITGSGVGVGTCPDYFIAGTIANCATGVNSAGTLSGATLTNNSQDMSNITRVTLFNTLLGSTVEYQNYNLATRHAIYAYVESIDHDQVAGAFRAWTLGGITSSVASPVYDASRARSYNAVCESADYPAFMQRAVLVPAGGSVYVRCYIRKDASMSYLPRVWIFSAEKEPLISGSPDAETIMTNSTDTWEALEATVTNATDSAKAYVVRMLAKNASGNVYFDPEIRVSAMLDASYGGGSMKPKRRGSTSVLIPIKIRDTTSLKNGGKTGLVYNSSGLNISYTASNDTTSHAISLVSMTLGAWVSGGFKEIDATRQPGLYQLGLPDAALAAGDSVTVTIAANGTLGIAQEDYVIELWAADPDDGTRFGLSALPNAAAGASGGLPLGDPLEKAVPGAYAAGTAGYKLGLLGAGSVTVVSPVNAQSGDLEIVRGDDYTVSSGRALPEWSSDGWSVYDLSAAESITFRAKTRYSETIFEKAAVAVSDTLVRVELTAAETSALAVGGDAYRFDVEAVLASGDVVTLAQGHLSVIEDVH